MDSDSINPGSNPGPPATIIYGGGMVKKQLVIQLSNHAIKPFYFLTGFTLIELLVVLLVFSLVAGLVIPRLTKVYNSWQITLERDEILNQLSSLNYYAFQKHIDVTLTQYPPQPDSKSDKPREIAALPLKLPDHWQIQTEQPVIFQANGVCSGGIVYLEYLEHTFTATAQLEPPFCRAKLLN